MNSKPKSTVPREPTADEIVAQIGTLRDVLVGDIVPAPWFSNILDHQGRPHYLAITLLADIVWRYIRYPDGRRKFDGKYYQLNRKHMRQKLNASSKAISRALSFLEMKGLVRVIRVDTRFRGAVKTAKVLVYPIAETIAVHSAKVRTSGTGQARGNGDRLSPFEENDEASPGPRTGPAQAPERGWPETVNEDSLGSLSVTESNDEELTATLDAAADVSPPATPADAPPAASLEPPSSSPQPSASTERQRVSPAGSIEMFWTRVLPLKRNIHKPLSDDERHALKDYFSKRGHWLPLSLAVLAVEAWEKTGMENGQTGYQYVYCQRSYRLEYFLKHVDDIADDCGLADCNITKTEERVNQLLDKLDKLTRDEGASDQIVAECFPEAWAFYRSQQEPVAAE